MDLKNIYKYKNKILNMFHNYLFYKNKKNNLFIIIYKTIIISNYIFK